MNKNEFLRMYAQRQKVTLKTATKQCQPVLDCLAEANIFAFQKRDREGIVPPNGSSRFVDIIADIIGRIVDDGVSRAVNERAKAIIPVRPTGIYATRYLPESEAEMNKVRREHPELIKTCPCCGKVFIAKNRRGVYCSDTCSGRVYNRRYRATHKYSAVRFPVKTAGNMVTINM